MAREAIVKVVFASATLDGTARTVPCKGVISAALPMASALTELASAPMAGMESTAHWKAALEIAMVSF